MAGRRSVQLTGLKIAALSLIVAIFGVVTNENLEAWAKLTAVPVLGGALFFVIYMGSRLHTQTLETHKEACEGIKNEIEKIGDRTEEHQRQHLEVLKDFVNCARNDKGK